MISLLSCIRPQPQFAISTYHSPQAMPFSVSVRLRATTLLSNRLSIEAVLSPHLMLCFGTPSWLVCIACEMTMSSLASIVAEHRDLPVETKLKNGSRSCPWTWRGTCGSTISSQSWYAGTVVPEWLQPCSSQ
jgi:hypothetical protein